MTKFEELYLIAENLYVNFQHIELNSQILTRYANPSKINLTRISDLQAHYLDDETQNVFYLISDDLTAEIKEFRERLDILRDKITFLTAIKNEE